MSAMWIKNIDDGANFFAFGNTFGCAADGFVFSYLQDGCADTTFSVRIFGLDPVVPSVDFAHVLNEWRNVRG